MTAEVVMPLVGAVILWLSTAAYAGGCEADYGLDTLADDLGVVESAVRSGDIEAASAAAQTLQQAQVHQQFLRGVAQSQFGVLGQQAHAALEPLHVEGSAAEDVDAAVIQP